jgi:hypothetical protein
VRWFEVKLKGLFQVGEGFFFGFALACHIDFQALGHIPIPFLPDAGGERALHASIVSQTHRTGARQEGAGGKAPNNTGEIPVPPVFYRRRCES